jgi:hypothetical protein
MLEERRYGMAPKAQQKQWSEPKVLVFGDVEALTLANNKNFGIGDSFTFQSATTRISG